MGMVVRSNIMAVNSQRQLGMNNNQVSKALEKLSSGYRINRAGDDASGLAISEKMKAQIKGLDQASLNSQDGVSVVQTTEGALTEVHNMLNRMVELATRAANGINSTTNRASLQNEVDQLLEEIDRIASSTDFNGLKPLSAAGTLTLQIGDTADSFNQLTVTLTDMHANQLNGVNSVDLESDAAGAISTIKAAIDTVSSVRAYYGAIQNRLEYTINNLDTTSENIQAANSRIRDTDMAKMMMEYTKTNVLVQSAQAMLAQANQQPQSVLQLLQ